MSTTLQYTVTVYFNRTAHSQHCLPAGVEARELNLKYARATGELNPETLRTGSRLCNYKTTEASNNAARSSKIIKRKLDTVPSTMASDRPSSLVTQSFTVISCLFNNTRCVNIQVNKQIVAVRYSKVVLFLR